MTTKTITITDLADVRAAALRRRGRRMSAANLSIGSLFSGYGGA